MRSDQRRQFWRLTANDERANKKLPLEHVNPEFKKQHIRGYVFVLSSDSYEDLVKSAKQALYYLGENESCLIYGIWRRDKKLISSTIQSEWTFKRWQSFVSMDLCQLVGYMVVPFMVRSDFDMDGVTPIARGVR